MLFSSGLHEVSAVGMGAWQYNSGKVISCSSSRIESLFTFVFSLPKNMAHPCGNFMFLKVGCSSVVDITGATDLGSRGKSFGILK